MLTYWVLLDSDGLPLGRFYEEQDAIEAKRYFKGACRIEKVRTNWGGQEDG